MLDNQQCHKRKSTPRGMRFLDAKRMFLKALNGFLKGEFPSQTCYACSSWVDFKFPFHFNSQALQTWIFLFFNVIVPGPCTSAWVLSYLPQSDFERALVYLYVSNEIQCILGRHYTESTFYGPRSIRPQSLRKWYFLSVRQSGPKIYWFWARFLTVIWCISTPWIFSAPVYDSLSWRITLDTSQCWVDL